MSLSPPPAPPSRPPPRRVEVSRVTRLTPRMMRVTFTGPELVGFATQGPATHVKLFLPPEGEREPLLPTFGPQGLSWPDGPRPTVRTYTPRAFHPSTGELDVDFFLHAEGPATAWAESAAPGMRAAIAGPGKSFYEPAEGARAFVLAGDESAIPAIATILGVLPATARVEVLLEVADASDEQRLDSPASLRVTWLHRGTAIGAEGSLLASTIRELELSPDARYWVACEAGVMRDIRRNLLTEHYVPAAHLLTRGYWKRATANHPDHDYGQDS